MSNDNNSGNHTPPPYGTMYWLDFLVIGGLVLLTLAGWYLPRLFN